MRLKMLINTTINGVARKFDDVVEFEDHELIDSLLRDAIAIPADMTAREWFRSQQPRRVPWVQRW